MQLGNAQTLAAKVALATPQVADETALKLPDSKVVSEMG
jgi:hypothetical protein